MGVESWLIELGFQRNDTGYQYHFRNSEIDLQLSVVYGLNWHFVEVFSVYCICQTSRTLSQPRTEISPACTSKEQVAAIIALMLQSYSSILRRFEVDLFLIGDANQDLHPMFIQQNERQKIYESRPHCYVDREWFAPFRKQLRKLISDRENEDALTSVTIGFDGNLLTFDWGTTRLKLPAEGKPWARSIVVAPTVFSWFPKRFSFPTVVVEYWDGYFGLGNRRYEVLESISETPSLDNNKRD